MASGNTVLTIDALLKEYYDDGPLVHATYVDNPLWALMLKERDVSGVQGRNFIHPIVVATPQGRSADFSRAQARGNSSGGGLSSYDFTVPRVQNYQVASISTTAVLATQTSRGAFVKAVTEVTDLSLQNLGLDQAIAMYGDGSGTRGNVAGAAAQPSFATSVLTLSISQQSVNFELNDELVVAATATGALRAFGSNGHGLYVGKVDRVAGTLTIVNAAGTPVNINDAADGIPTIANGDFIFARGDQGVKMLGLEAWIPYGGPSATTFCGVDRTVDNVRLAGQSLDATSLAIEDALIQAASNVALQGGKLTHFFMPYNKFAQLCKSQSSKVVIVDESMPNISFEGLQVLTASGPVTVIADRNCPPNRIFGLNLDSWAYTHVADPVQVFNLDGNTWLRQSDTDGMEIRFFSFGNLVCRKPSSNITLKVNP